MIRTSVGYAGGTTDNPDYRHIGDHSETVRIEFDPRQISYEELLAVFWDSHDPSLAPYSRQYRNAIFCLDEEQCRQAQASAEQFARSSGRPIRTVIEPAGSFYLAEGYHQKYLLRGEDDLLAAYRAVYPDDRLLTASTAAARVNGYLGCNGSPADLEQNLPLLGLSRLMQERLVNRVSSSCRGFKGMTCPAPR